MHINTNLLSLLHPFGTVITVHMHFFQCASSICHILSFFVSNYLFLSCFVLRSFRSLSRQLSFQQRT